MGLFSRSKAGSCAADAAPRVFEDAGPPAFWAGVIQRLFAAR